MIARGRPLRFLVVLIAGWATGRLAFVLADREAAPPPAVAAARSRPAQDGDFLPYTITRHLLLPDAQRAAAPGGGALATRYDGPVATPPARPGRAARWLSDPQILALVGIPYFVVVRPAPAPGVGVGTGLPAPASVAAAWTQAPVGALAPPPALQRWRLDGWLLARSGDGAGRDASALTPQLGGGQAGARLAYTLAPAARVAAFARVAAPLRGRGAEVAAGMQWQPSGTLPVTAYAELRQRDRGGASPTVGAFGGVYARPLPFALRLDGYAQAGWAGGRDATGFVDGQLRVDRPLARRGAVELAASAGGWGAAQRGAARLDLGPGVGATLPLGGGRVRAQLDWRWRVAGDARPASGPALTLAAGF